MTARWGELDEKAVFEVRAFKEGAQTQTAKFAPDWIDEAVDWITNLNKLKFNIYAVRNPVRHDVSGSASDSDILASFYLWADCDDEHSAGNVYRFDGPKYSAAVVTGTVPSVRVHTYWQLNAPCADLDKWRDMQTRIAAHFGSDGTVVNPSRIMRVGGTVSFPAQRKRERGYVDEICTIRTEYPEERAPVSMAQMDRVFAEVAPAGHTAPNSPFDIDTGGYPQKSVTDYADILRRARTDGEKHSGVRDLTASMAGAGVPRAMCEAVVREACPVWDAGVETLINTAYAKFYDPSAAPVPLPEPATPQAITDFPIDSSEAFLADLEPLEYLIDGLLPTGVAYSLTGHAGHGKTTLALQMALSVAQGELFADRETSQGDVIFLAGENPYNVKWQYAAALAARKLSAKDAKVHFVQGRFSINQWAEVLKAKLEAMPNLKLIVIDSLQAFFEGDNDNDNSQMVEMAHKLRAMCSASQRPAVLIIAHPAGKTPSKENLVPRGGGAFLNEIDGNLTVWSQDASQQTLHHSQKFRGAGFDPLEWVMQVHEFSHLTDVHGTPLKLPVSRPETTIERANREVKSDDFLRLYVESVEQDRGLSEREGASQFGISRHRMRQIMETAKDEKLVKRYAKKFIITEGGKAFLEDRNAG
jgi:archaellum biogenesis ATPase FlaH